MNNIAIKRIVFILRSANVPNCARAWCERMEKDVCLNVIFDYVADIKDQQVAKNKLCFGLESVEKLI